MFTRVLEHVPKGVFGVDFMDYSALRDAIVDAFEAYDLQTTVDEAVFLNTNSRACEIYVHRHDEPREVWAKLGFEWVAANQTLYDRYKEYSQDIVDGSLMAAPGFEVMMHASFHLHFGLLPVAPDAMRSTAEDMSRAGELFFGEEGSVVAEVSMTTSDASLECLRYEVNTAAPLITEDSWWDQLAEVFHSMLDKLQEIFERLNYEYGSPR